MKKEIIEEGNKLIAVFDEKIKDTDSSWWRGFDLIIHSVTSCHEEQLKYHTSWDWLLPVCKKAYAIWMENHHGNERCAELFEDIWSAMWHFNIEDCFDAVVEFIKWYTTLKINKPQSIQKGCNKLK